MLKKIMAVDVILITIFFLTNYLFLILKVDYISSMKNHNKYINLLLTKRDNNPVIMI